MRRRRRGTGSVYQLAGGGFEVAVDLSVEGKRKRVKRRAKSQAEANDLLHELQGSKRAGTLPGGRSKTVALWLTEDWLPNVRARRRASTYADYRRTTSRYLIPWLGKRRFAALSPSAIEAWLRDLGPTIGPRALSKIHAVLSAAMHYAQRMELIVRNPVALVEAPAYKPKPRRRYSIEQVVVLLRTARAHDAEALLWTAMFSQLRQGELFSLRWSDVDLAARTLTVARTMTDDERGRPVVGTTTKTPAGLRAVALPKLVVTALREHRKRLMAEGRVGEYVFPDAKGGPLRRGNVARRWLRPLQEAAGVPPITFHELRHTGASLLREGGGELEALRDRMGHESIETTADVYVHPNLAAQRRLATQFDKTFGPHLGPTARNQPAREKKKTR